MGGSPPDPAKLTSSGTPEGGSAARATSLGLFQAEVARIALTAAKSYGFALGGGHALIAHGLLERPTEDVDLFTDDDAGVQAATGPVSAALTDAGLTVELIEETSDLGDIFYGFDQGMVEFEVIDGAHIMRLTLARFDRVRDPVTMALGPVLHLDDVIGSKVAAMATRAEPRDFVDVAAALHTYSPDELTELAHRSDPALTGDEIAEAMRSLDKIPDRVFHHWIPAHEVPAMRASFADWPRR